MKIEDIFEGMVDINSIMGITASKNHDRIQEKRHKHYKEMRALRRKKGRIK